MQAESDFLEETNLHALNKKYKNAALLQRYSMPALEAIPADADSAATTAGASLACTPAGMPALNVETLQATFAGGNAMLDGVSVTRRAFFA
jgi:hypothetical protein